MRPEWVIGMWVAAAAAMLGVVVAAAASVGAPPLWLLALLIVLPAAITIVERLRRQTHRSGSTAAPQWEERTVVQPDASVSGQPVLQEGVGELGERTATQSISSDDWNVVSEICCALRSRELDWLRSEDFLLPWLDVHAQTAMELEPVVGRVVGRPFRSDVRRALSTFADDLRTFSEYYRHNTRLDPLLLGGEWRFFRPDNPAQDDGSGGDGGALPGQQDHLQHLALALARSYEGLKRTASRNPNVRRRIAGGK